jgi:hypothetical protein
MGSVWAKGFMSPNVNFLPYELVVGVHCIL